EVVFATPRRTASTATASVINSEAASRIRVRKVEDAAGPAPPVTTGKSVRAKRSNIGRPVSPNSSALRGTESTRELAARKASRDRSGSGGPANAESRSGSKDQAKSPKGASPGIGAKPASPNVIAPSPSPTPSP